jgi:exonuclease SbcD
VSGAAQRTAPGDETGTASAVAAGRHGRDAQGRVPDRPADAVRVLHTSDWHLGVTVRGESRAADHDALIAELCEIARAAAPDLIVHTGDLFDGHRPPMHDFGRAIRALRDLAAIAPVVLLAGNHDSPVALDVLGVALEDAAVHVLAKPVLAEAGAVSTFATACGAQLRLVALPFVHQNRVIRDFGALVEANATYNDSLRKIIASYSAAAFGDFDPARDVAVFASHVHVRDAKTSSEKTIHIAEDYATDPAHFEPRYGYLAFGHIHVPQAIAGGRGRYAGSLLEVDFGEEGEAKQVVVVDLTAGRPTKVHEVGLTAGRRLFRVRASLAELGARAADIGDGVVEVTVLADPVLADPVLNATAGSGAACDSGGADRPDHATTGDSATAGAGSGAADRPEHATDDRPFDTLSAAVRALLPRATIVGIIDGRSPSVAAIDELAVPDAPQGLGDTFRSWLAGAGRPLLASQGEGAADAARIAELFDEIHAAVLSDAPTQPIELDRLVAFTEAEGR